MFVMHKKSFGVFVISLLMFSLFVGVVSAQLGPSSDPNDPTDGGSVTGESSLDPISEFFNRLFAGWSEGTGVSQTVAKLFIAIIIGILVYGVADRLPGLDDSNGHNRAVLRWIISIIVAFLGTAYLSGTELMLIISQYNALGFALGAALPWFILSFFTYDILSQSGSAKRHVIPPKLIASLLWVFFVGFMIYRIFTVVVPAVGGVGQSFSQPVGIAYWAITMIGFFVIIFMGSISHFILKESIEDVNTRARTALAKATAVEKAEAERADAFAGRSKGIGE